MSTPRRAYDLLRGYINREWERIEGVQVEDARRELMEFSPPPAPAPRDLPRDRPLDRRSQACLVLGVAPAAEFAAIRAAFLRLNRRSSPGNFPADSPEAAQAAQIQRRVQQAYRALVEELDVTEVRFKTLEIE